jgi:AcrR family transcriptional regulator
MPDRRAELLGEILDHIVEHGVGDLFLRSMADAIRTSHRMLLYYFGSKEELIRQLYGAFRERLIARGRPSRGATLRDLIVGRPSSPTQKGTRPSSGWTQSPGSNPRSTERSSKSMAMRSPH